MGRNKRGLFSHMTRDRQDIDDDPSQMFYIDGPCSFSLQILKVTSILWKKTLIARKFTALEAHALSSYQKT